MILFYHFIVFLEMGCLFVYKSILFHISLLFEFVFHHKYLQLIIPQYFISNKSGIWSLSLIVHSKG